MTLRRPLYCLLFAAFLGLAAYFVALQGWHSAPAAAFFGLAASIASAYFRLASLVWGGLLLALNALDESLRSLDA